uniref:Peptidase S54 rhomboid domain-containing protein n=1 Tax=Tetradesmus obliquus TaxID=3088 RepID=A0A383W9A7_TETOB|eukprot:jgi/Sobl393_1/2887/SZX74021.1
MPVSAAAVQHQQQPHLFDAVAAPGCCVLLCLTMQVYSSYYVVQLTDGQQAADDLLLRLTNDHAAVASGDSLRLFTAFFVSDSIQQLVIGLLGLATVAAELESLLGYSTFWAVWCVTVLAGSLADAALSGLPITAGPAPGVGGAAAALLAHHLHNWRVEQMLAQAKAGQVPQQMVQLEDAYNRQQRQLWAAEAAAAGASTTTSSSSSSSSSASAQQQGGQQPNSRSEPAAVELIESELEGPLGLSVNIALPREGKAFITLGGAAVGVVSALQDAANSDTYTDWPALSVGFAIGAVLGWLACPVYSIELEPASSRTGSSSSSEEQADLLLPVLRDMRPPAERANAVVGTAAILFAVLGVWLISEGMFMD